jgi:uncharacterized membrane protein YqaE (UPF0057 family)
MGYNEAVHQLKSLVEFSGKLIQVLVKLIEATPKLLSLFMIFTNPGKVIKDTLYGVITGIKMLFEAIFDSTIGSFHKVLKPYFIGDGEENKDKQECISPTYMEILLLILCPPLAIFVRKGIKAFLIILIACGLTYLYYFPGLIYATLHII